MAYVVAKQIAALFRDFDEAFSDRDRTTDGTIGDPAHQAEVSGHNPDDTPGVQAEYQDADTKAEVRAGDIDVNLHSYDGVPDMVKMQQVLDKLIATPNDIRRLKYIIFNRRIASRNTNWRWVTYTGKDPHTNHAHASGDPNYDEDGSPYTSILSLGGDMTPSQQYIQHVMNYRLDAVVHKRLSVNVPKFTATDGSVFPGFIEPCEDGIFAAQQTKNDDEIKALVAATLKAASEDPTVDITIPPEQINEIAAKTVAGVTTTLDIPTAQEIANVTAPATVDALQKELAD